MTGPFDKVRDGSATPLLCACADTGVAASALASDVCPRTALLLAQFVTGAAADEEPLCGISPLL